MAAERQARGRQVEAAVRQHLQRAGLRFLAGNVGYRGGELDLVMQDPDRGTVVFVEVRYRASSAFGGGAGSVDRAKRRRLVQAAQLYLASQPALALRPCRFDVADASGDPAAPRIDWIVDAFRLDDI